MIVEIEGLPGASALRAHINRKLEAAFARRRVKPVSIRVGFVDQNGPKGGPAVGCRLTLDIPRRPPLHVEHRAERARPAFEGASEALERQLTRERGRGREQRRRPKKYYVAKRLLEPETPSAKTPSRRRSPSA
jgi:ribosome-associated translation inhibitor RaiA